MPLRAAGGSRCGARAYRGVGNATCWRVSIAVGQMCKYEYVTDPALGNDATWTPPLRQRCQAVPALDAARPRRSCPPHMVPLGRHPGPPSQGIGGHEAIGCPAPQAKQRCLSATAPSKPKPFSRKSALLCLALAYRFRFGLTQNDLPAALPPAGCSPYKTTLSHPPFVERSTYAAPRR